MTNEQIIEELEEIITVYADAENYNVDEIIEDLGKLIDKLK